MKLVLIETLWNVKTDPESKSCVSGIRINRNIVECKVLYNIVSLNTFPSINRNIVECKGLLVASDLAAFHVLIETLWNVKQDS